MKCNRITLSGFAGSGKSALGKKLAKNLKWDFISIGIFTREFANSKHSLNINDSSFASDIYLIKQLVSYKLDFYV